MPIPSVFDQADVRQVPAWSLFPSPRSYNASICDFHGKRWMAYRSHRMDEEGRCAVAMCEIVPKTGAGHGNHWLNIPSTGGRLMHHEDPRLFVFRKQLHIAYTETHFPASNLSSYVCAISYARLDWRRGKWVVAKVWTPRYGKNDGGHREKNWAFFEHAKALHVVYQAEPHTVIRLAKDGESVEEEYRAPAGALRWPWGEVRGGSSPVLADGRFLTFFHSSTPYPVSPHWRRYYAGAYAFEAAAPFRPVACSQAPVLTGSEADGHSHDPRSVDSWKPFVVFPCGAVREKDGRWAVSYGINDYLVALARHPAEALRLGDPTFTRWGPEFYRTENGARPVRMWVDDDRPPVYIRWKPVGLAHAGVQPGVLRVENPRVAMLLRDEVPDLCQITEEQYHASQTTKI